MILTPNQSIVIKQAKFTYSTFGKTFKKNKKTNEHQGRKELKDLKVFNLAENQQKLIEETFQKYFENN